MPAEDIAGPAPGEACRGRCRKGWDRRGNRGDAGQRRRTDERSFRHRGQAVEQAATSAATAAAVVVVRSAWSLKVLQAAAAAVAAALSKPEDKSIPIFLKSSICS